LAGLLRIVPIRSGLPYSDYVDEGHVLHQTIDAFNNHSLDVYWYGLPPLPAYCAGAALVFYGPLYRHFHGHGFRQDLPHQPDVPSSNINYDFIAPVELIVAGRIATACLSLATVILAGILASRIASEEAGLLAMVLVAVCPALVTRASNVIVDTFAAFFVLLVLYLCARISTGGGARVWRGILLAGLATGLAFASKYPAAIVGIALITTILSLSVPWRRRFGLFFPAAGGCVGGILLGAPMTFFKPITVWHDIVANIRAYAEIRSAEGYFRQAISMSELGVPLLLVGSAGIILMLRRKETRAVVLGWICFAALLIASFMGKSFRPFRSFLPLIAPLCIAAAVTFSSLIDWARRGAHRRARFALAAIVVACLTLSLGFSSFRLERQRMAHKDTRIQAIDWLQKSAAKEMSVLGIRELAILPTEWSRIAARRTVVPWFEAADLLERQQFDYVVTGDFDLRYASDPQRWSAYRDRWISKVAALPVQAEFGQVVTFVVPYVWRTNDERLFILKRDGR
jgi:MFS family permease